MASEALHEATASRTETEQIVPGAAADTPTPGFSLQTVGGVFDAAFDLYKQHFATLALIVACVFIPTQVILHAAGNLWLKPIMASINGANPDPFAVLQAVGLAFITGAPQVGMPGYLSLLTSFMASGPVAVAVANILVGRPLTVSTAYRRAVPVFWRLFAVWNLLFVLFVLTFFIVVIGLLIVLGIVVWIMTYLGANTSAINSPEVSVVLVIVMIALPYIASCAFATMLFAFAPPLVGLENLSVTAAVERNSRLIGRKYFWRVCLSVTLLPVVTFGLQTLILGSAGSVVEALKWPAWADFVVGTGLSSLISFFFQPYWMIFLTLLYFDIRVRQEGLDVRYLADNLPELDDLLGAPGAIAAPPSRIAGVTPPPLDLPTSPPLGGNPA